MKQQYFILVFAHSLHGRLRRIHIPHKVVYSVLALALVGGITVAGFVGSYLRMALKVADYNNLRTEFDSLRERYQALQRESTDKTDQLASLQMFATEVSLAYGIKQKLEGPADIANEGSLMPTYGETLEEYNFLKSATFSIFSRKYPRLGRENSKPTLWPVNGHFTSYFGKRADPLTGFSAFHPGVDLSASLNHPALAAGDGVVVRAEWAGRYGRLVVVDHGGGITTYYGHLNKFEVIAGQEVRRGQIIGRVGHSGRTTGDHLHYEIRMGGNPVNPYTFLKNSAKPAEVARSEAPF
jgi:murein DD-endopeptidase MepM/ murein hydrolase activator NlpD